MIGLFPGITGAEPKSGIGILQVIIILMGMMLIVSGSTILIKASLYSDAPANLMQRIAVRLSLTGLLFSASVGLADVLGYGSNPTIDENVFPILGPYQAWGMVIGFGIAALGVLVFGVAGPRSRPTQ